MTLVSAVVQSLLYVTAVAVAGAVTGLAAAKVRTRLAGRGPGSG